MRKTKTENKDCFIILRVTKSKKNQLVKLAKKSKVSISDFIRKIVDTL